MAWKQINRKIPIPRNAKEHYQLFIRKNNTKTIKHSEIITYQPKTFENPNNVDKTNYYRTEKNFTEIIQDYKTSWKSRF